MRKFLEPIGLGSKPNILLQSSTFTHNLKTVTFVCRFLLHMDATEHGHRQLQVHEDRKGQAMQSRTWSWVTQSQQGATNA